MKTTGEYKDFITEYFKGISGKEKTRQLCERYIADEHLLEHIIFFEATFPKYEIFADEMTCESNRITIRARMKGKHEGELNGIPPTFKEVEFPFAVSYTVENGKIADHWLIADQMELMQQLGVMEAV
jgi:predicted ester cyclase